jgi:hypothetical protein
LSPGGYSRYKACSILYILFKLEEIKKSEAISLRLHTVKADRKPMCSHSFFTLSRQIYWYLRQNLKELFIKCKHRRETQGEQSSQRASVPFALLGFPLVSPYKRMISSLTRMCPTGVRPVNANYPFSVKFLVVMRR